MHFFYLLMGLVAYTCIAAGTVLMKKGISWIGWKGQKTSNFYRSLLIWISGFLVMNFYGVPSAVALKGIEPSVLAAMSGWGIVLIVFLSKYFLKEEVIRQKYTGAAMIVAGIAVTALFSSDNRYSSDMKYTVWFMAFIPLAVVLITLFIKREKVRGAFYSVSAGMFSGIMVIFLKILVSEYGYNITEYLKSEFLYLYIGAALLSLIVLQIALKLTDMIIAGPLNYSSNIIYPFICSFVVSDKGFSLWQASGFFVIVLGVFFITGSDVISEKGE